MMNVAISIGRTSSTPQAREHGGTPDEAGPSWQSRYINNLLRLLPIKRRMASAAVVQEHVRRPALRPASYEPKGLGRGVQVTLKHEAGWPVYRTALSATHEGGNSVLFLHGGGYINEIVRAHWRIVGNRSRGNAPNRKCRTHPPTRLAGSTMRNCRRTIILRVAVQGPGAMVSQGHF